MALEIVSRSEGVCEVVVMGDDARFLVVPDMIAKCAKVVLNVRSGLFLETGCEIGDCEIIGPPLLDELNVDAFLERVRELAGEDGA